MKQLRSLSSAAKLMPTNAVKAIVRNRGVDSIAGAKMLKVSAPVIEARPRYAWDGRLLQLTRPR